MPKSNNISAASSMLEKPPSLLGAKTKELDEYLSDMFLKIMFNPDRLASEMTPEDANLMGPLAKILFFRIRAASPGTRITAGLGLWCVTICNGSPGNAVLWTWTLHNMAQRIPGSMLTLDDWARAFPLGVPTEEELSRVWTAQKKDGYNLLDQDSVWEILPLEEPAVAA